LITGNVRLAAVIVGLLDRAEAMMGWWRRGTTGSGSGRPRRALG
jgi:hypothetical protein